jgi:hypothetical protein
MKYKESCVEEFYLLGHGRNGYLSCSSDDEMKCDDLITNCRDFFRPNGVAIKFHWIICDSIHIKDAINQNYSECVKRIFGDWTTTRGGALFTFNDTLMSCTFNILDCDGRWVHSSLNPEVLTREVAEDLLLKSFGEEVKFIDLL